MAQISGPLKKDDYVYEIINIYSEKKSKNQKDNQ